jgi:hypothetical protein
MKTLDSHLFGWISLFGVVYTSLLYFWNIFYPIQEKKRVNFHCTVGKISIVTITGHLFFQPLSGIKENIAIWLGLGIYLIIIVSGIVLNYLPGVGGLRFHARSVHSTLVAGLFISLALHLLQFYEVL